MLAVTVTLLHGTIRAGSPDDTALAGADPTGEWPPSPARLFSALVAGDGTGARCTNTTGDELIWLEGLDPPIIHASPPDAVEHSALLPRYVVVDQTEPGAVQDYPARKAKEVRPGARLSPRERAIIYVWPQAAPSEDVLRALSYRAARVGYLGCSDSPVRITVSTQPPSPVGGDAWEPAPSGTTTLPVPYPGFLEALDRAYARWSAGEAMGRAWITTRRARYRAPNEDTKTTTSGRAPVIWLRFGRSVSSRHLLGVTTTLRAAVTDHLQRLLGDAEVPVVVHGHRPAGEKGPQADFVALPDAGHCHATGRLLGAAICLPAGIDPMLVEQLRTAAFRVAKEGLHTSGLHVELAVFGGEPRPWAANPRRWSGPATEWVSVTPVVHERWTASGPDVAEVERWCAHAGFAGAQIESLVASVSISRRPLVAGAVDLPPALVFRAGKKRWPYSHLRLRFASRVEGPLVLGRARQLGFGLFAPADDEEGSDG
jgi:CRISPR-associated protein Csb2